MDLIFTKDALVADVHFFSSDPADRIAQKAMRVNLSDLAAMGAKPVGYLVALAIPRDMKNIDEWVAGFASGLKMDQDIFGWSLFGGDTVSTTGPLTISITAIGLVKSGQALRRFGAKLGDDIYVSGNLGDSALGLKCLTDKISPSNNILIDRYYLPIPRIKLGQNLWGIASSVMDISDGLVGDIGHIAALSGLGAEIKDELIPKSEAAGKFLEIFPQYKNLIWQGGDDYELLFTAPANKKNDIQGLSRKLALPLTKIGHMTDSNTIVIQDKNGMNIIGNAQGFRHF